MVGLEPSVAVLHEFADYQTRQWLVYDLEEPFRWIADVTVMDAFESQVLDLPDFYFTGDDYRYRIESEAKQRFIDHIRERFNSSANNRGRILKWDTVIEQKTVEFGRFLIGGSARLDFAEPTPTLYGVDDQEFRRRILSLSSSEAQRLAIPRSTLHYLRKKARSDRSFKVYGRVREKLDANRRSQTKGGDRK